MADQVQDQIQKDAAQVATPPPATEPDKVVKIERHLEEERKWKARNAEIEAAKLAAEAELAKYRDAEKKAKEAELSEIEKARAALDAAKQRADKADKYEAKIKSVLESAKAAIPEDRRGLVPESLPIEDQLDYIEKNRAFLMETPKPAPVAVNGAKPASKGNGSDDVTVTPEDIQRGVVVYSALGLSPEEAGKRWAKAHGRGNAN